MDIVAALFIEAIDMRPTFEGGPTLIDLGGVHFSTVADQPPPLTLTPHLIVLVRGTPGEPGQGALEVVFRRDSGEQVARNVQPLQVEPGKFTYRLVRAELEMPDYGTVEARCRIDDGRVTAVPLTLVPGPGSI
ncbi:MAG TPA: hypothetical protein VFZ68_17455 [Acidimicrobiales bacterium]